MPMRKKTTKKSRKAPSRYRSSYKKRLPLSRMPKSIIPEKKNENGYWGTDDSKNPPQPVGACDGTGTPFCYSLTSGISSGTSYNQRTGNKIFAKYAVLDFEIFSSTTPGAPFFNRLRWALVQDSEPQGTAVVSSPTTLCESIWDINGSTDGTFPIHSQRNPSTFSRYRVLRDRTFYISYSSATAVTPNPNAGNPVKMVKIKVPINKFVTYPGSATGEAQKNGIYFIAMSSADANEPAFIGQIRLVYTDA